MASKDKKLRNGFGFEEGMVFGTGKYRIRSHLGSGVEGEVYLTEELDTGIERAAKFFFPTNKLSIKNSVKNQAQKLYKIRNCSEIIQYHTHEKVTVGGKKITCLISEYVEGELLTNYIERQPGKRLHYFEALHLIYAIVCGLQVIHSLGEYHGDLHDGNIFVKQVGMRYQVKLIDAIDWRDSPRANIKKDICDLVRVLYDLVGGQRYYAKMPQQIKEICSGLKTSVINRKFKDAGSLKTYLENVVW
jgi:hypothetical protein